MTVPELKIEQYLDVLYLGRLIELVSQVMEKGYGEVNFKVTIQQGKIQTLSISSTETIKIEQKGVS